jgi:photosystem II stability/assembly factor-like uncharacterized protein
MKINIPGKLMLAACLVAIAPARADVLAVTGPLSKMTMERLLLIDAARIGNRVVAVGDRGYIVYSDDNGASWKRAKTPPAPLLTGVFFIDQKTGWAVGHDGVIFATTDGGETWAQQFSAASEQKPLLDVLFINKSTGFAVGAYGSFYETTDAGKTWNARKIINDDKHLNRIVKIADDKLLIVGEAGTLLLSGDAGKTWAALMSPYKGSFFGALVSDNGALVIFGLRGKIFRSADSGKTWKLVDNASVATLMGGSRLPDGALVIAGNAGVVLVSRDNGQSFTRLDTQGSKAYSKALLGAPNAVLLLGEAGARDILLPSAKR